MKKLAQVLKEIVDPEEMKQVLEELLTPKEQRDLALRWQLLEELYAGKTQRSIASRHKISLCKITRGAKILKRQDSVTARLLQHHQEGEKTYEGKKKRNPAR